ncbi:MAG: hypothetical protein IPO27_00900 [Bacteroidetes bacterium]|nr:hypothetical protein [Bacteroidota bacterium]
MKKVKHLIVAILFLTTYMPFATAQKQAWHWYFGYNAGIDFSSGAPGVVTNGAINCLEGVASMSDSLGNLLFYTDGRNVYDATHNNMPNGFNLLGHTSSTQSAVIVKKPGANNLYYIFTMDYNHDGLSAGDGFNYSIVDMNLNGSLGDVVTANMPIRANVFEKICATKHGNNMDYWIMINDWIDDDIYAYLLDSTGLNLTPVISNAGPFHGQDIGQSAGYFKANRQGNKLALALWAKTRLIF